MVEISGTGFERIAFPRAEPDRVRDASPAAAAEPASAAGEVPGAERVAEARLAQLLARLSQQARRTDGETTLVQAAAGGKPRGSVVDLFA